MKPQTLVARFTEKLQHLRSTQPPRKTTLQSQHRAAQNNLAMHEGDVFQMVNYQIEVQLDHKDHIEERSNLIVFDEDDSIRSGAKGIIMDREAPGLSQSVSSRVDHTFSSSSVGAEENLSRQGPSSNPENLPYTYMLNNLLTLLPYLSPQLIKLHLDELEKRHSIPQTKIFIFATVEWIIYEFYRTHEIKYRPNCRYIVSELQQLLPKAIALFGHTNLPILHIVVEILWLRFQIKEECADGWLIALIRKNKSMLRAASIDLRSLLFKQESMEEYKARLEKQVEQSRKLYKFTTLRQYLKVKMRDVLTKIQLEDSDEDEIMEDSRRKKASTNLKYYRLLQKKLQSQRIHKAKVKKTGKKVKNNRQILLQDLPIQSHNSSISMPSLQQGDPQAEPSVQEIYEDKLIALDETFPRKSNKKPGKSIKTKQIVKKELKQCDPYDEDFNVDFDQLTYRREKARERRTTERIRLEMQNFKEEMSKNETLQLMDQMLYEFYVREPQFTMETLTNQISRILAQMSVPLHYHKKIADTWLKRYKASH